MNDGLEVEAWRGTRNDKHSWLWLWLLEGSRHALVDSTGSEVWEGHQRPLCWWWGELGGWEVGGDGDTGQGALLD